jgi:hypothetical protein
MRTRTNPEPSQAAVARLQQQSDCRIHIERNIEQVRLFGPKNRLNDAQRLLQELSAMCIEEEVDMQCPRYLDLQMLQTFAQEFGVTLQVEENHITVLGIDAAVKTAAGELRKYDHDQNHFDNGIAVGKGSDDALMAVSAAMTRLVGDGDIGSTSINPGTATQNSSIQTADNVMQGAVISKMPLPATSGSKGNGSKRPVQNVNYTQLQAQHVQGMNVESYEVCPTCGGGNFCVNCGKPTRKIVDCPQAGCPTCHSVRFCIYCGQPTERTVVCEPSTPTYKPNMYYAEQVPMMPMQFLQAGAMPNAVPSGMANAMQMASPQPYAQDGMMTWIQVGVPVQQGLSMQPGSSTGRQMTIQSDSVGSQNGLQVASNMIAGAATGIQACMVPWTFGSFE